MIKSIYKKYFQKSKSFLYPALGIKKNSEFKPKGTYLSIKDLIAPEDVRLICTFDKDNSEKFKDFEIDMLVKNPLFIEKIDMGDFNAYVFDFEIYSNDWFNFIMGKYSKLSNVLKKAIKSHFGANSSEYEYIQTYLYPQEYYETYSRLLDISVETLEIIGELCNPCDLEKETLKISGKSLQKLKK
jgi:hypothetical protein